MAALAMDGDNDEVLRSEVVDKSAVVEITFCKIDRRVLLLDDVIIICSSLFSLLLLAESSARVDRVVNDFEHG